MLDVQIAVLHTNRDTGEVPSYKYVQYSNKRNWHVGRNVIQCRVHHLTTHVHNSAQNSLFNQKKIIFFKTAKIGHYRLFADLVITTF